MLKPHDRHRWAGCLPFFQPVNIHADELDIVEGRRVVPPLGDCAFAACQFAASYKFVGSNFIPLPAEHQPRQPQAAARELFRIEGFQWLKARFFERPAEFLQKFRNHFSSLEELLTVAFNCVQKWNIRQNSASDRGSEFTQKFGWAGDAQWQYLSPFKK